MDYKILFLDNVEIAHESFNREIKKLIPNSTITNCFNSEDVEESIRKEKFDIFFIDQRLSDGEKGTDIALKIKEQQSDAYIIMATAYGLDEAIAAIRTKAFSDFISKSKDDEFEALEVVFKRFENFQTEKRKRLDAEEKNKKLEKEISFLKVDLSQYKDDKSPLKGNSNAMRQIRMFIDIYGKTLPKLPVLLLGETGTGKEIIAREIHIKNPYNDENNFHPVNCAAIPENLIESTLFGHVKGAFTGADKDKKGEFELAANGTLFLDEFGELSKSAQNKILRVVEYGDYTPVGSTTTRKINNVRIICATSKKILDDNDELIKKDLLYRLSGFFPEIPPLRKRKEDIKSVLNNLTEVEIPEAIISYLEKVDYDWPGNVRELINFAKQAVKLLMVLEKLNVKGIAEALALWKDRQPVENLSIQDKTEEDPDFENSNYPSYSEYSKKEIEDIESFLKLANLAAKEIEGTIIDDTNLPEVMNKINKVKKIYNKEISLNSGSSIGGRFKNHKRKIAAIMDEKHHEFEEIVRIKSYQKNIAPIRKNKPY